MPTPLRIAPFAKRLSCGLMARSLSLQALLLLLAIGVCIIPSQSAELQPLDSDITGSIAPSLPSAHEAVPEKADPLLGTPGETSSGRLGQNPAEDSDRVYTAEPSPQEPSIPVTAESFIKVTLEASLATEVKGPHAVERRAVQEAIAEFYAGRDFVPAWFQDGTPTQAARSAERRLMLASEDGLDLKGFSLSLPLGTLSPLSLAEADLSFSEAIVAYAHQAEGGRIDPQTISHLIGLHPEFTDPILALTKVSEAQSEAGTVLQGLNPPQKGYAALRQKLAELRAARPRDLNASIPAGPDLKIGMRDPRVPLIRARLSLDGRPALPAEDLTYDTRVAAAVAGFQKANGLPGSGVLTNRTISILSGGRPSRLESEILSNMERWRWMPRDMGNSRIEVNIPDFEVMVIEDGAVIARHKVVVGKEGTPTPVFSNKMQFLIVNPYWNVPPSILKKEMLPKLAQDPGYLHRLGYEVVYKNGHISVRQPPGERNALGRIKFMFPNDYAVYLHDTPSRALFGEDRRAFSHGCVRVDDPFAFAQIVLGKNWSEDRVRGLIGGKEKYVFLPKPLPIHLEYFTTYVDAAGHLQLRDDIYGYSRRVKIALGLSES